jgi:hypothetical protein
MLRKNCAYQTSSISRPENVQFSHFSLVLHLAASFCERIETFPIKLWSRMPVNLYFYNYYTVLDFNQELQP